MGGTGVYYLHQDALGSTRLVSTSTVSIKFSSNYVPYGSNYAVTGKESFMYTGKTYDAATGLYYFLARYYDPMTGRFVTQDSHGGDRSDPMTLNFYIYVRDNPERYVDPNGHAFLSAVMIDGIVSRPFVVQPITKAPDVIDINKVSYTPSLTTVTAGTSTKSVDMTLTTSGVDQYAHTPTIGATPPQNGLLGAVIVTLGVADLTIFVGAATAVAWGSAVETGGVSVLGLRS